MWRLVVLNDHAYYPTLLISTRKVNHIMMIENIMSQRFWSFPSLLAEIRKQKEKKWINMWDLTLVGEENETFFIRVWKPLPSRRVLKPLRGSSKGKVQRRQYLLVMDSDRYIGLNALWLHSSLIQGPQSTEGCLNVILSNVKTLSTAPFL